MNIGNVLLAWRHHKEMTLDQASRQIGIPLSTLDRIEKGAGIEHGTMTALIRFLFE